MAKETLTPGALVAELREQQKNNKEIKALFAYQLFGQMSYEELEGLQSSIEKEVDKRKGKKIQEQIDFLKHHGYDVEKK